MARSWTFTWILFGWLGILATSHRVHAEDLDIALSKAARDPLIELFVPPPGSPDRMQCTRDGLVIRQRADVRGRKTGVAGFKLLLPAHGDFEVKLDLKVLRLEEPTDGWGQGLILEVFFDDPAQTVVKLGRLAFPGRGTVCQVEINHIGGKIAPIYRAHKIPFTEGTLAIARDGDKVAFTVNNGQKQEVLETFPCPADDVSSVELVCTRLDKGNTRAEFLLRHLHVKADHFFAYQQPKKSWFSWWYVVVAAQLLVAAGLVIAMVRQRRK